MFDEEFKKECQNEISLVHRQILSPVQFYQDFFDGVFDSEYLTQIAIDFTKVYFDFEKGQYLKDYEELLERICLHFTMLLTHGKILPL